MNLDRRKLHVHVIVTLYSVYSLYNDMI